MDDFNKFQDSSELFSSTGTCPIFEYNRTCKERLIELRQVESIYQSVKDFLPNQDFIDSLQSSFYPAWWDLYLLNTLKEKEFEIIKPEQGVPGIALQTGGFKTWIITVSAYEPNQDRSQVIKPRKTRVSTSVSKKVILSYVTQAFSKKANEIKSYIDQGVIGSTDRILIAIDLSNLDYADMAEYNFPPLSAQALVGIGNCMVSEPFSRTSDLQTYFITRYKIDKSGSLADTQLLLDPQYHFISGVITKTSQFPNDLHMTNLVKLLLNPHASNKIDMDRWAWVSELWHDSRGYLVKHKKK